MFECSLTIAASINRNPKDRLAPTCIKIDLIVSLRHRHRSQRQFKFVACRSAYLRARNTTGPPTKIQHATNK